MTVDLLPDQTLKIILPGGEELLLSNRNGATRIEHWQGHALSSFFTLQHPHDPDPTEPRPIQAGQYCPAPGIVCPTSRPI